MKILFVGDSHGDATFMQAVFSHARRVGGDCVFQLGDFGYGWGWSMGKGGVRYDTFTSHIAKFAHQSEIPCYWLGGNHENYDAIDSWFVQHSPRDDGTYEFAPLVYYVPRGLQINFGTLSFLCCGGAVSIDRDMRHPGTSWWEQEAITEADVEKCAEAGQVDVLLAHDFPWECNVVDRHLDPYWGERAQRGTEQNRQMVSRILDACGATRMFHGHLHRRYDEVVETTSGTRVLVTGLDCNYATPLSKSIYLFDTETIGTGA